MEPCSKLSNSLKIPFILFQKNVKNHLDKNTNRGNRNKVIDAIFHNKDCLMSSTKKNFENNKKEFVETYKEFFNEAYLERLLDRLENNVFNPSLLNDMITSTWTNNDGKKKNLKVT